MRQYIHVSSDFSPYDNLALEEALLNLPNNDCVIFYLYRNAHTVVIGKNQNVWRECRVERLKEDDVTLSRRITGGGAVFHDLENLCFSFIAPAHVYDVHRQLNVILQALRALGIEGEFSGRNDLLAKGRKFSGNAFCRLKDKCVHHGTLLIGTDMHRLARYLQIPEEKMRSKGVESVRDRVINLQEIAPSLTVELVSDALFQSFENEYGKTEPLPSAMISKEDVRTLSTRNASWDWLYGTSPKGEIRLETRFEWGGITINLSLEKGIVSDIQIYSDALDLDLIDALRNTLTGARYDAQTMSGSVREMYKENQPACNDLADWLSTIGK